MHYTAIAGYNLRFKKKMKNMVFQPAIMMKYTNPVPMQLDSLMVKGIYDKKIWLGLTYRTTDAASVCTGFDLKERYSLGYAFDYSVSGINQYQTGTHEIVMSFVLTKKKVSLDEKDEQLNNSIMDQMKKEQHKEELEK